MGGGGWDSHVYASTNAAKAAAGKDTFDYSNTMRRSGRYEVHADLDPKKVAGDDSPLAGKIVRESRDSDEHPNSVPVMIWLDVTGSNIHEARIIHEALPNLFALLLRKGYVTDPQIAMCAVGDGYSDRVPLQVAQFESDNRIDEALANMFLEGGGGGGNHESYNLALYYAARHTATDAWDKRSKKGYLFLVGDERTYRTVDPALVKKWIGVDLEEPISTADILKEAQERWEVYYIFCEQASYTQETVLDARADDERHNAQAWRPLLGQNAIVLSDTNAICEVIAVEIGLGEGSIDDVDEGLKDIAEIGSGAGVAVGQALAHRTGGGGVAVAEAPADLDITDDDGAERL